jgi:hypothetical protein
MAVFINTNKNKQARKIARKYKVNPNDLVSITLEIETIVIDYVEYYKNDEIGFCQKRISVGAR